MIYQLSYELRSTDKDYTEFLNFLDRDLGDSLHVMNNVWWISNDTLALDELCQLIKGKLEATDVFFLTAADPEHINGWMANSNWAWFRNHLSNNR